LPETACIVDRRSLIRLFPGLRLLGALRLAFDFRKLIIAAIGLALLQFGWSFLDRLFPGADVVTPDLFESSRASGIQLEALNWTWSEFAIIHARVSEPFQILVTPVLVLFNPRGGWLTMLHALLSLVWLFIVWGISGAAICRIAIVQVAKLQQTGIAQALSFSFRRATTLIVAPLLPLLGIALCATIGAGFGLMYRLGNAGNALAGIFLFVPLLLGLVMTMLAAGLITGWPLLHAAAAAGAEDTLDAFSRVFGYLSQRLGSFLASVGLAWLLGMIGTLLVALLAGGVIRLTVWNLGALAEAQLAAIDSSLEQSVGVASATHAFWLAVVRLLAHGWVYSYFWTVAALLYLWLRHDVDGTPWDEIEPGRIDSSAAANSIRTIPETSDSPSAPLRSDQG
jgi:hypothetical protein